MFERYLAEALAVHFGQFVEDFDADKVKISVWNGEVVLKDLKLKRDAFQRLLDKRNTGDGDDNDEDEFTNGSEAGNDDFETTRDSRGGGSGIRGTTDEDNDEDRNRSMHHEDTNSNAPNDKNIYNGNDEDDDDEDDDGLFPCQISYGHIGTFELHIPWTLLRDGGGWSMWGGSGNTATATQSNYTSNAQTKEGGCSITLSDVNILINPGKNPSGTSSSSTSRNQKHTTEEINQRLKKFRIRKERQVQKILDEALFRKNIDFASAQEVNTSQQSQFMTTLIQNIVSSLTITVRNVHIRYEDPGDCLGFDTKIRIGESRRVRYRPPFAIGITLKEFTVYSTENGPLSDDQLFNIPDMVEDQKDNSNENSNRSMKAQSSIEGLYTAQHKLAAAKDLSIYWDSDLPMKQLIHISTNEHEQRRQHEQDFLASFSISKNDEEKVDSGFDSNYDDEINEYYASKLQQVIDLPHDQELHSSSHRTYIIEPISPSLHFSVISELPQQNSSKDNASVNHQVPPSRAVLTLPPFQTNLSKDTIEDIGYLRKSFGLWKDMRNSVLTRKVYTQFMKLRPNTSPKEDPKGWWLYAFGAVKILSKLRHDKQSTQKSKKTRGWIGLSHKLQLQKKYIVLYEKLLETNTKDEDLRKGLCTDLNKLEDRLTVNEIVAFRAVLIVRKLSRMKNKRLMNKLKDNQSSTWSDWISPWSQIQTGSSYESHDEISISRNKEYRFFSDDEILSPKHRESIIYEITDSLDIDRTQSYESLIDSFYDHKGSTASIQFFQSKVYSGNKLEVSIICPQVTLQAQNVFIENSQRFANGELKRVKIRRHRPIVQLAFSSVQKYCLRHDSSWDLLCTLASLEVLNLMNMNRQDPGNCQRLLTRKNQLNSSSQETSYKSVRFGDISHFHSATVVVQQKRVVLEHEHTEKNSRPSTTVINVNISPMEATYSLESINALADLFSTTQTTELISDYQRLKSVLSSWRAQQKRKLLQVLAQREKTIIVKVDVAAPVFYMHDDLSNGTLMIDLGNLTFHNSHDEGIKNYDDAWRLLLTNIQVSSLPRSEPTIKEKLSRIDHYPTCHIIEPFSLDFIVYTRFGVRQWSIGDDTRISSEVFIKATLPRLVFNLTSSSVRLLHRLKAKNSITASKADTREVHVNHSLLSKTPGKIHPRQQGDEDKGKKSIIKFEFSAPLVAVNLSNDVDGRDCSSLSNQVQDFVGNTPLIELVIQGIGGRLSHCSGSIGEEKETVFVASLRALRAKDLYQKAGREYSMLLSSQRPESYDGMDSMTWAKNSFNEQTKSFLNQMSQNDLVRIEYEKFSDIVSGIDKGNLKIKFHELYVEWNPETLAAIQKAMRLSLEEQYLLDTLTDTVDDVDFAGNNQLDETYYQCDSTDDEDTVYFDADELDEDTDREENLHLHEDFTNSQADDDQLSIMGTMSKTFVPHPSSPILTPMVLEAVKAISTRRQNSQHFWVEDEEVEDLDPQPLPQRKSTFAIFFHLSKLRVRFNKESRFRRLITAEMSETAIRHETKPFGGTSTNAKVGNLSLSDPSHFSGATLYGEILGIKSDVHGMASLLEIQFETFPRSENETNLQQTQDLYIQKHPRMSVRVNSETLEAHGCDNYISLHFSPMRFVLLEQLWLEIIDYFFEGILGFEVWGKIPPKNDFKNREKEIIDEIKAPQENSMLAGANANGVRFNLFEIVMDSPTILMPVTYRSPQHLSFDISKIRISNQYSGKISTCESIGDFSYVQWYNNCHLEICELSLSSWCGKKLSIFDMDPKPLPPKSIKPGSIPLDVSIKWPTGPYAQLIVPKWDIQFHMTSVRLLLRKVDFALFRNVIWHNIGEESRHLDEWNALQSLPFEELEEFKKRIMVHFGYDKKDAPPTTYSFSINIETIHIHLCNDVSDYVADIDCFDLKWSLVKKKDKISRQQLVCEKIHLEQTSDNTKWGRFRKLFFPLETEHNVLKENVRPRPQLFYTSTSRPTGDNVKYFEVNDACIIFIYPAWINVKSFFQGLPSPDVMHRDEVINSLQIGDRWYRINKNGSGDELETFEFLQESKRSEDTQKSSKNTSEYQFRMVLVSPRIVLVDCSSVQSPRTESIKAVTLRLGHLDFFRKIDSEDTNTKALFVHDLELFTGFAEDAIRRGDSGNERSLIFPICIGAGSSTRFEGDVSDCTVCEKWFIADIISARAAYTDMTLAIDVLQNTMSDYRSSVSVEEIDEKLKNDGSKIPTTDEKVIRESTNVALGGFELLIIDDSGRHFLNAQELVQVSLSGIHYNVWKGLNNINDDCAKNEDLESITRLQLQGLEIIDYLQSANSPFRLVAATKGIARDGDEASRWENMNRTLFNDFMTWDRYSMVEKNWGYRLSSSLLERMEIAKQADLRLKNLSNFVEVNRSTYSGQRDDITLEIREIVLQWNPSMAIALQRFLGRLKKQAVEKKLFPQSSNSISVQNDTGEQRFVRAELSMSALTLCLNKEHQRRRLLQVTLSDATIVSERDHLHRLNFHGFIGDISAWDCDNYSEGKIAIRDTNRLVLCVLRDPAFDDDNQSYSTNSSWESEKKRKQRKFLSFQYFCRPKDSDLVDQCCSSLPQWVIKTVGEDVTSKDIDDCLSLSVAAIRFNYLRDRTGELIDYLSNGLPGKGMGATSRAAKGFIKKRLRTRSYLLVALKAPQIFLPRHCGDEEGIMISLGDVYVRSWFDEASLQECEALKCEELTLQNDFSISSKKDDMNDKDGKYLWRILSVSFLDLGWRIHSPKRNSLSFDNPVDLHLHLRKPPADNQLPLILRCKLSIMDLVLSYMDYILLRSVLKENLLKTVDKTFWDNVDDKLEANMLDDNGKRNNSVIYSENARIVRYGTLSRRNTLPKEEFEESVVPDDTSSIDFDDSNDDDSNHILLDLKFSLAGLNLVLHRDDPLPEISSDIGKNNSGLNYDIVSFEIDQIELGVSSTKSGAKCATVKLQQLSLFDQGDVGRIAREKYMGISNRLRKPSVFSVIAESYDTFDANKMDAVVDDNGEVIKESQLTLTVDTRPTADVDFAGLVDQCQNTTVTVACLRMNYMNINPLIRPIKETTDFLFCNWRKEPKETESNSMETLVNPVDDNASTNTSPSQHESEGRAVKGFQLRIVANYPRVFLIADECNPASRALVLRGLVVVTANVIKEVLNCPQNKEGKTHLLVEGKFHSLESYINPQPRNILENDVLALEDTDMLGVALIEPVTAEFHFHQVTRINFPMTRDMYIKLESVSTTLSFEDIYLVETVLSRWQFANKNHEDNDSTEVNHMNKRDNMESIFFFPTSFDQESFEIEQNISNNNSSIAQNNSADMAHPVAYCGGYVPCDGNCGGGQTQTEITESDNISAGMEYKVKFTSQTLGLALRKTGSAVVVDRIIDSQCVPQVFVGDEVLSINSKLVSKMTLQTIVSTLADSPRPLTIGFKRSPDIGNDLIEDRPEIIDSEDDNEEHWDDELGDIKLSGKESFDSVSSDSVVSSSIPIPIDKTNSISSRRQPYCVTIKCGTPHGLTIESSPCGNVAIVSSIKHEIFKSVIENAAHFIPKPGHLILAIDDKPAHVMGFKQIQKIIHEVKSLKNKEYCKLTFVELTSEDWGPVNRIDMVISGMKLTIIDDIAGRDMPLLRWGLDSIAVKTEQGLGLICNNICVQPPSLIKFDPKQKDADSYVISDLSEVIFKICASLDTRLDYYNARIASWEPFLEPCQINGDLEYQQGRADDPGALSMALSDHRLSDGLERQEQTPICVNLTDAAANILISALYEWKHWRERLRRRKFDGEPERIQKVPNLENRVDDDYKNGDLEANVSGGVDSKRVAVQNAAQAALIYAKRRGLDSKGEDGSKPFVLRNKTGMDISFVPQMQQNFKLHDEQYERDPSNFIFDLSDFLSSSVTIINNDGEACFNMDRIESDLPSSEINQTTRNGNKIRSYDGLFPLLSVCLQCPNVNTAVQIAQDLSVVKIGKQVKSLFVKRSSGTKSEFGYIHVIWSVELERNRRIITLSSAISLTSPMCSIPIEVGVKIYDDDPQENSEDTSNITSVGFATPETDCFLPLWVDLCFKRAEIFIRPKDDHLGFKWSSEKILEFKGTRNYVMDRNIPQNWKWFVCNMSGNIICNGNGANSFPAWLSYEYFDDTKKIDSVPKKNEISSEETEYCKYEICLSIFTSLSIRNILPESLEWEVFNGKHMIDGSTVRNSKTIPRKNNFDQKAFSEITSGDRVEVLTCDSASMDVKLRFRCSSEKAWTNFLALKDFELKDGQEPKRQQKNLFSVSESGTPLTLGVQVIPKSSITNKGFDLVLYSELWLCNLTSLPILFGTTSQQLTMKGEEKTTEKSERALNAETALLELSSILEFGEKGHSFLSDYDKSNENAEILNLPKQQTDEVTEEVFEYVEVEKESVKRRWWAGEKHNNPKLSPDDLETSSVWIDEYWKIDVSGECKAHQGGWESCSNLVGGSTKYFSESRTFDIHHRYRRRRWYRKRKTRKVKTEVNHNSLHHLLGKNSVVFHQPIFDTDERAQMKLRLKRNSSVQGSQGKMESKSFVDVASAIEENNCFKIFFKVGDGIWSKPAIIPNMGNGHGIVKVESSRWPKVTSKMSLRKRLRKGTDEGKMALAYANSRSKVNFCRGSVSARSYELSYQISTIEGPWGEHSRILMLYPRFILRNDSDIWHLDVKQSGTPDSTLIHIASGSSVPFYWSDSNLPQLICVRPVVLDSNGRFLRCYRWSGALDICDLGMIPLRIREESQYDNIPIQNIRRQEIKLSDIKVVRSMIEIRSGTGGTGITISFKEESPKGDDSLYRIENHSPFPLWIAQDGVLANPKYESGLSNSEIIPDSYDESERNGDKIDPGEIIAFGLDVPFRQGKYAGRRAALFEELMTIRIALAPLSLRDGIETMKVVALAYVGSNFRLKPSHLRNFLSEDILSAMASVNVQGVVCADGPTRVLKLSLVERNVSTSSMLRNTVRLQGNPIISNADSTKDLLREELIQATDTVCSLLKSGSIPKSDDVDFIRGATARNVVSNHSDDGPNCVYSLSAFFSGFVVSFIDTVPSEIAVISLKKVDFMARWDEKRLSEAEAAISIEWLQIDNQCPSAPFPVAFSPLVNDNEDYDEKKQEEPFLTIGIAIAPRHKSNIVCLKGLSIKPRDVSICTDLAFIMRMQHFFLNIQDHFDRCEEEDRLHSYHYGISNEWVFPDLNTMFKNKIGSTNNVKSSTRLYFESLSIVPFNIKLSVAPAVALSAAQMTLEGPEAGAIHAAVRKGDVLVGDDTSGVLGVKIGGKNRTALAVIRGIFKSILVDSLLRFDGASMSFSGVILRNHIATIPQLKTYIGHHYLSLLKSNVPALLGSLAAFGNPVGLIRGFGDGVTDFVSEPIKGFKKSVRELDPSYAARGVARGTGSLARNTVGGIVDSASLLTESFSKSMAVLTLDRKYAQRRDRFKTQPGTSTSFVQGVESGMGKLLRGVAEGVIGVVRAPVRGAEKRGVEGFAKGVGKGLLGLVVKPVIGLSDAATDVMVGVKGSLDGVGKGGLRGSMINQIRPRRAFYGNDRSLRPFEIVDAVSSAIMMRTRLAGENYLSHVDLGGRVAILSVKRFLLLGEDGETQLLIRLKNVKHVEMRHVPKQDENGMEWGVLIFLNSKHGNDIEVITTEEKDIANELCTKIKHGISFVSKG